MSENAVRHLIALCGTTIAFLAWLVGYGSGIRGWWFTVLAILFIYWAIYSLIEA